LCPQFADETGRLKALVQAFLIKSAGKNILIDTCIGNDKKRTDVQDWANLKTTFLEQLLGVGVKPGEVDVVACTHLHLDHVGWNTTLEDGAWVPTFRNARYLFARREFEYWAQKPAKEIGDHKAAFDDSVSPIVEAGLATLVEVHHRIDPHVRFIPTPGHTPAHVSVLIESHNQRAIISGDFLHHPCQIARPQWATEADTYAEDAARTREQRFKQIADTDTLLLGSHFANRVVRSREGYTFQTATATSGKTCLEKHREVTRELFL
jgi:glyoxylase-like metal-dependent hydrolase (beta-lactamase superfamily II)